MTTVYLIRHGHTDAIDRYIAGTAAGTPLDTGGEAEALALVEQFRAIPLRAVVSSPLTRTQQTAAGIAASHGLTVQLEPAFAEVEFGGWTGRRFRDLDDDDEWRRYNTVRSLTPTPGGELMLDVQARAMRALIGVAAAHPDGAVAVVSHGDVIRTLLMACLAIPIDFVHRLEIAPARISVVTLDGRMPVVRQVNGSVPPPPL